MVSAWQIARKEKEGEEGRRVRYINIPGAEFKIHVNIIRLAVHFLEARKRLAVHRTTNERGMRIDASISSVVDRRRHELYSSTDRWRPKREGIAAHTSQVTSPCVASGLTRCFLPSLMACPYTTRVVYLQVASWCTSAMGKT